MGQFTRVTTGDATTQRAIQELQDTVTRLQQELARAKSGSASDADVSALRAEVQRKLRKPNTLDFNDVFRPAGETHAIGYVPDPGPYDQGGDTFLSSDGTWKPVLDGLFWTLPEALTDSPHGGTRKAGFNGSLAVASGLSADSLGARLLQVGNQSSDSDGDASRDSWITSNLGQVWLSARSGSYVNIGDKGSYPTLVAHGDIRGLRGAVIHGDLYTYGRLVNRRGFDLDMRSVRYSGSGGTQNGGRLGLGTTDWIDDVNLYSLGGTNNTRAIVAETGLYLVGGSATTTGGSANDLITLQLLKNGSAVATATCGANTAGNGGPSLFMLDKATVAGDYYEIKCNAGSGSGVAQTAAAKLNLIRLRSI